ncbi:LOW QUALITY PROTEIN: replication factor C subunit 4 [Dermatophagoides farinae]|uniref:LOW QUALITY PROTEIN: replication factor C subunit 4 n=1 Tax=Dermatophagoides farinae TaxID=6954 RepID=UPI003F5E47D7
MDNDSSKDSQSTPVNKFKTWVEKYRPSRLDDIVYQNEIVNSLKSIIASNACNLPNFLFYGPPGTGKTSTIIALSKQLFGVEHYKNRVLELNASDERGIQVIRDKVKSFAQRTISNNNQVAAIKIIVLDECDSMTKDAQSALRRIMEKYSATTRFCLICNYVSKIIDPIISRCTVYRFKPLKTDLVKATLLKVGHQEGFKVSDKTLDILIEISEGDLRKAITLIQTLSLINDGGDDDEISSDDICEIAGQVPLKRIEHFFNICRNSKSYSQLLTETKQIIHAGYSATQFLCQLQEWLAMSDECLLNDGQKSRICWQIGIADKRLLDGCDEFLQLLQVGSCIMQTVG